MQKLNSGIYIITNLINSKYYVGYTYDFADRKRRHFQDLIGNRHPNKHMQSSFNKHGLDNFTFEILEEYPNEENILASMEHYWCNLLDTHNDKYGYNIKPTNPYGNSGISEETKVKISLANKGVSRGKGKKLSDSHRKNISLAKKGTTMAKESKLKRTATRKQRRENGEYKSTYDRIKSKEEVGQNISKRRKGIKPSKESVEKGVATRKSNGYTHTEETRQKIGNSNKGNKRTEEEKIAIGNFHRGKKMSPETIAKREASRKITRALAKLEKEKLALKAEY